jgi:hypothetical protein
LKNDNEKRVEQGGLQKKRVKGENADDLERSRTQVMAIDMPIKRSLRAEAKSMEIPLTDE